MRQTKKERTKKEIMEAAKNIIHTQGYDALTVRHLAEVTGYAYTNLYYYFKDLNALLWAVRLDMIEDMITSLTAASPSKDNPVEEMISALFCYTDYFYAYPNVFRFFYFHSFTQPEGDESEQKLDQRFQGIWQASFGRLVREGILQPDEVPIVAKTILYALHGMIMLRFSTNGFNEIDSIKAELAKLVNYLLII